MKNRTTESLFSKLENDIESLSGYDYFTNKALPLCNQIEAKAALNKLSQLLKLIKPLNDSEQCTKLTDYLSYRWPVILNTDNIYNFSHNTPTSKIFHKVASILAENSKNILTESGKKHAYHFLMPDVLFDKAKTLNNKSIYSYQLHEFILSKEGDKLIPVTLDYLFTSLEKKEKIKLEDESMISEHSLHAENYYQAIKLNKDIKKCREEFYKALSNGDTYVVTASYGQVGTKKMISSFTKKESITELYMYLCSNVNEDKWLAFLNMLPDECFFRIILKKKSVPQINNNLIQTIDDELKKICHTTFDFNNNKILKAFIICLLKIYYVTRNSGEKHNTKLASYIDRIWHVPSQNERLDACKILMKVIITSPIDDLKDVQKLFLSIGLQKYLFALTQAQSDTLPTLVRFLTTNVNKLIHAKNDTKYRAN